MGQITEFPIETFESPLTGNDVKSAVEGVQEAKSASSTDTTSGRLMKVGDFGVGATTSIGPTTITDTATFLAGGLYGGGGSGASGFPVGSNFYGFLNLRRLGSSSNAARLYIGSLGAAVATSSDGQVTWDVKELYHTGNILGTVSQSSGTPTGAIVERGSNSNGEYVKFADGTMVCTSPELAPIAVDNSINGVFRSSVESWSFPESFVSDSSVVLGTTNSIESWVSPNGSGSAGSTSYRIQSNANRSGISAFLVAIGRWY